MFGKASGLHRVAFAANFLIVFITLETHAELPELIGRIVSDTTRTLFGTTIVPLGDQNDDGYDDILVWDYRPAAYLFYGGNPLDTIYDIRFDSVSRHIGNLGDVNSDGFDDFATNGHNSSFWRLNLYLGGPALDTIRDAWFGLDTVHPTRTAVNTGDINANGKLEFFCTGHMGDEVFMFELGSDFDSVPDLTLRPAFVTKPGYQFGDNVVSGDFNGDDTTDLAVNLRPDPSYNERGSLYFYWGGVDFDTIPDLIIAEPGEYQKGSYMFGWVLEALGDVSGDDFDDLFASPGVAYDDTFGYVFFGGPDIDTIPDRTIVKRHTEVGLAGDVNDDGHNDIVMSYPLPFGGGPVEVFYGGPSLDSIPDISIFISDLPGYMIYFGMDCTGVGDVNGDGIDDFAFSTLISSGYAAVYVFAGAADPTAVEDDTPELLPHEFELYQNYPNPFNSSTTIEFDLIRRSRIRLEVDNMLGQSVATLVNATLSAGKYAYQWDGHNSRGEAVSSGVYIYKLTGGDSSKSRKMLFLK